MTAAFFRHRTRERWNQIKIQQMEQELVEGGLQTSECLPLTGKLIPVKFVHPVV